MVGIFAVAVVLIFLYLSYKNRTRKFEEIERQQAMRRAVLKLHEDSRRYGL